MPDEQLVYVKDEPCLQDGIYTIRHLELEVADNLVVEEWEIVGTDLIFEERYEYREDDT